MTPDSSFDELDVLRSFRAELTEPPAGMQERIEERLWTQIMEETSSSHKRRWWHRYDWSQNLVRQGALAGVAAVLIIAISFTGGKPTGGTPARAEAQTDPLEAAISSIRAGTDSSQPRYAAGDLTHPPQSGPLVTPNTAVVFDTGETIPLATISAGPSALTPEQLAMMPTHELTLLAILRAAGGQRKTHDRDFEPFRIAALYISDRRVPAENRVAFIRLLRLLEGVDVGGVSLDVFGRPGVRVTRLDRTSLVLQEYLLDEHDGRLLEHREYIAYSRDTACPAGSVIALEAFDSNGFQVDQSRVPYGNWPTIVPECDPAGVR